MMKRLTVGAALMLMVAFHVHNAISQSVDRCRGSNADNTEFTAT